MSIKYGVQMYSIKDVAQTDLKLALKTVAENGYKNVEFAGFFGNSAEDVKSWLVEYGLTVTATHTGLAALTPDTIAETVAYHKAIGCDYIIVPHAKWTEERNLEENIAAMNEAQKYLAEQGITLAFHNHSVELLVHPYGKRPIDEIISRTALELEPDVFFFHNSGFEAVEFLEKYKSRIRFVHLKDGTYPTDIVRDYSNPHEGIAGCALGLGSVPIDKILSWVVKNELYPVVEVECKTSSGPIETKKCIDYLHSVEDTLG